MPPLQAMLVGKRSLYRQSAISAWNAIAGPEIADQGGSRAAVASPSQALTVAYPALSWSDGKGERMLAIDGDDIGKAVAVDTLARLEMPDAKRFIVPIADQRPACVQRSFCDGFAPHKRLIRCTNF